MSISEHLVQLFKNKKFWIFFVKNVFFLNIFLEKIFLTKSFVNFSPFSPANMVPASGGHLSERWNHAGTGLFSFDLILSELLLEHDIFKIDFISWAPTIYYWLYIDKSQTLTCIPPDTTYHDAPLVMPPGKISSVLYGHSMPRCIVLCLLAYSFDIPTKNASSGEGD